MNAPSASTTAALPQYKTFVPKPMTFLTANVTTSSLPKLKPNKKKKLATLPPRAEPPRKQQKIDVGTPTTQPFLQGQEEGTEQDGDANEGVTADSEEEGIELGGVHLIDVTSKKRKNYPSGGRPKNTLLDELLQECYREGEPERRLYRCTGEGCTHVWTNRGLSRTLRHSCSCRKLSVVLRKKAKARAASQALSKKSETYSDASSTPNNLTIPISATAATSNAQGSNTVSILPFIEQAKKKGRKDRHASYDLAVLKLICGAGLPTSVVSSDNWKELWAIIDPTYKPATREELEVKQIVSEVEGVRAQQLEYLRTQKNLTISCDGGTSRAGAAFWTVHVSMEDGCVYFADGREATAESHTGLWITNLMIEVSIHSA